MVPYKPRRVYDKAFKLAVQVYQLTEQGKFSNGIVILHKNFYSIIFQIRLYKWELKLQSQTHQIFLVVAAVFIFHHNEEL